ncbi:MAG: hypothetical protein EOP84_35205, partial [Verrucomicrobiaceae bacterium]
MDNLVRGYERMPIMHFDYDTISAEATTSVGGKSSGGRSGKFSSETDTSGAISSTIKEITKPDLWEISPSAGDKVTLGVKPVLTNNAVYE